MLAQTGRAGGAPPNGVSGWGSPKQGDREQALGITSQHNGIASHKHHRKIQSKSACQSLFDHPGAPVGVRRAQPSGCLGMDCGRQHLAKQCIGSLTCSAVRSVAQRAHISALRSVLKRSALISAHRAQTVYLLCLHSGNHILRIRILTLSSKIVQKAFVYLYVYKYEQT